MHVDVQLEEAVNYGQLPNRLLTAFEVAEFIGCHEETVRRAYLRGLLVSQRFGVSGLAMCALIGLFADDADVAASGYWIDGLLGDGCETGPTVPVADCWCRSRIALGDADPPPLIG